MVADIIFFNCYNELEMDRAFFSKSEFVYQTLKKKIVNGYLERNKIYTIVEIADSLGISRTPVAEAVKILVSQNYILMYHGVGFKVREITIEDIRETLTISGALEEAVIRKIVKDEAAVTDGLKYAIRRSWKALEERTPERYTEASGDFHSLLYGMSGFHRVTEILRENVCVHEIWYREGAAHFPELIKRMIVDHENMVDIIQNREERRISGVVNCHVENCAEVLTKVIKG